MKLNKKLLLLFLVVILVCTLGFNHLFKQRTVSAETAVQVQTPAIPAAIPLLWMEESGELEGLIDLEINLSPDHQRALSLISKEQVDMIVTGANVGAKAYNQGIDLSLLNINTWGIDYLLTNDFKADDWSDLEGRSLSLPLKGGPLDFLARYLMKKNGVNPEDVEIVYRPLPNGARYFMTGKVDAIILPEPLVTVNLKNNEDAVLSFDIQEEWAEFNEGEDRIPFVGLFVSNKFAKENKRETEMINGLYMKGIDWVNENPEEAAKLAAEHFDNSAPVMEESLSRVNLDYFNEKETNNLIDKYFRQMLEMYPDLLGGEMPDENFYFQP